MTRARTRALAFPVAYHAQWVAVRVGHGHEDGPIVLTEV